MNNLSKIQSLAEEHFSKSGKVKVKADYSEDKELLFVYLELNQYTVQALKRGRLTKRVDDFFEECKKIIPLYMKGTIINGLYGKNLQLLFYIRDENQKTKTLV
ncbi:hypothetical protein BAZ12_15685 [Elizabethkingia miricola]|uniref:hypothetical protein n=1 Tax=Elizabethkingia miricola TaxID=172045 RepID=UPI00099A25AA|nr:hypothetical protein [Elizabethkingia miricola]OPC67988.1 hypothetical protein BAZ12_15685 [Elizabethkingia miricola]